MLAVANEVRRLKCYKRGIKFYRPVICLVGRSPRLLRHLDRTAEGAMSYGRKVMERYLRWCDLAAMKDLKEVQPA